MPDIINFFKNVFAGEFDFHAFIGELGQICNDLGIGTMVTKITEMAVFAFIALALGAICLFYGKKWLGLFKFVACAAAGYAVGTAVNSLLIDSLPFLDGKAFISGALFALVCAVLHKLIYTVLYFGLGAVFAYVIFYAGGLIPMELPTEGNAMLSYIAVAAVLFVLLVMRKNVERLGTAFLGAFLINTGVVKLYDYTALLPDHADLLNTVVICVLALLGFMYQYKRRRRY